MVLLPDPEAARSYPTGAIRLGFCRACGFIGNLAFRPEFIRYDDEYEASQAFSPTFNAFHAALAERLVDAYGLRGKTIVEIGCGQGDFLSLLCALGGNSGIGFDPSFSQARLRSPLHADVNIVADHYSQRYADIAADFVICKMTLEHIPAPAPFLREIRVSLERNPGAKVFFQIPNAVRILEEAAFWDVYYEHCSYFTPNSLSRVFRAAGFDVLSVQTEYEGQYLSITAGPSAVPEVSAASDSDDEIAALVDRFAEKTSSAVESWNHRLHDLSGRRVVLWGGGSKAVGFLSALEGPSQIEIVVDINPFKQEKYLPPFGQRVVAPAALASYRPDVVVVMNPIYKEEVRRELSSLGLAPALLTM